MKISEIITDKYKLSIPPTVYYDLLADVVEAEEEQEPKTGQWQQDMDGTFLCSECGSGYKEQPTLMGNPMFEYCPICGAKMIEPQESEDKE